MESNFVWIYWEFFDMHFPWINDTIYQDGNLVSASASSLLLSDSDYSSGDVEDPIESVQAPPNLHCNYDHVEDTTYDFWTLYDDSKFGGDEPDSIYGVKLHLIAPNGSALNPIQMSVHSDYLPNPDYDQPVKYTTRIDLSTLYTSDGLWHYYFSSKDDSGEHSDPSIYPEVGYLIGPAVFEDLDDEQIIGLINNYEISPRFKSEDFHFQVSWATDSLPGNVYLCLIPAVKDTSGTGISRTSGVQKYPMTIVQNPIVFDNEYECTLNFTQLNYLDSELGQFTHYYEAVLSDGTKNYLYDISFDEEENVITADFKSPLVITEEAQLVDYNYYSAVPSINLFDVEDSPQTGLRTKNVELVARESGFYFEVVFVDPNDNGFPDARVIFENVVTEEELEFDMDYVWGTPLSAKYGEDAVSCMFYISGADLNPGLWRFRFEAKDGLGITTNTICSDVKLWSIGSLGNMDASFTNTINLVTSIPMALFMLAGLTGNSYPHLATALAFIAGGFTLVSLITLGTLAVMDQDPGSLLGYAGALFFCTMGYFLAGNSGSSSNIIPRKTGSALTNQIKVWSIYQIIVSFMRQALTAMGLSLSGESLGIVDFFWFPIEVITMVILSMFARFALDASKLNDVVKAPIESFLNILPFMLNGFAIVATIVFLIKTQAYAFFWD